MPGPIRRAIRLDEAESLHASGRTRRVSLLQSRLEEQNVYIIHEDG